MTAVGLKIVLDRMVKLVLAVVISYRMGLIYFCRRSSKLCCFIGDFGSVLNKLFFTFLNRKGCEVIVTS